MGGSMCETDSALFIRITYRIHYYEFGGHFENHLSSTL